MKDANITSSSQFGEGGQQRGWRLRHADAAPEHRPPSSLQPQPHTAQHRGAHLPHGGLSQGQPCHRYVCYSFNSTHTYIFSICIFHLNLSPYIQMSSMQDRIKKNSYYAIISSFKIEVVSTKTLEHFVQKHSVHYKVYIPH